NRFVRNVEPPETPGVVGERVVLLGSYPAAVLRYTGPVGVPNRCAGRAACRSDQAVGFAVQEIKPDGNAVHGRVSGLDNDVPVQVVLETIMTDGAGLVKKDPNVGHTQILAVRIDRCNQPSTGTKGSPAVAAYGLGEAACNIRSAVNRCRVKDMYVVDTDAFVIRRGVALHDDADPNMSGVYRKVETGDMPFRIGSLPGLADGVVIPVGAPGRRAEPQPVHTIRAVFDPVVIAVTVIFRLEDMAEGQFRLVQAGEVETGGIQVGQLVVVIVAGQAGHPAVVAVGGAVDHRFLRCTPLPAAV